MAYPYMQPQTPYYQPYYQPPLADQLSQLRQQPQAQVQQTQPQSGVIWVQGEEAAKAFLVSAGSSVLLMDSESTTFYIKSTDNSGMPLPLRIFDYVERSATPKQPPEPQKEYVTREEFDKLSARIDALSAKPERSAKKNEPTV